tara:strand:- start:293 stop:523 length:231 start_codon:yes stop_codon:yes gene_type:complete
MGKMVDGYVIQREEAPWDKRFWVDLPAFNFREFGEEARARIFISKDEAEVVREEIEYMFGVIAITTKKSDLFPGDK